MLSDAYNAVTVYDMKSRSAHAFGGGGGGGGVCVCVCKEWVVFIAIA